MRNQFPIAKNIILACHISGVYDVNRNTTLSNDDFSIVADWANSIAKLGLLGVLFHNNFSESTCSTHENEFLHFEKIEYNSNFNPNVFRYFLYKNFLLKYASKILNVFFTDVSDVILLKNPFLETLYIDNPTAIFCGDEPEILENEWMHNHSTHFRESIPGYQDYETEFKDQTLLNCGVFGGTTAIMIPFIEKLSSIHDQFNSNNKTLYTGDMGAFNFLVRTQYNDRLIHGNPVNTIFKMYENSSSCWFKHK